jgi:hypothetical protein
MEAALASKRDSSQEFPVPDDQINQAQERQQ